MYDRNAMPRRKDVVGAMCSSRRTMGSKKQNDKTGWSRHGRLYLAAIAVTLSMILFKVISFDSYPEQLRNVDGSIVSSLLGDEKTTVSESTAKATGRDSGSRLREVNKQAVPSDALKTSKSALLEQDPAPKKELPLDGSSETRKTPKNDDIYSQYNFQRYSENAPSCEKELTADKVDITIATQTSVERIWMLEHFCANWKGHISLAVYIDPLSEGSLRTAESISEKLVQQYKCPSDQVLVHTVEGYSEENYPFSILRNTALSGVKTSHAILADIDFWIPPHLYQQALQHAELLAQDHKLALVIPAFELKPQCAENVECREENMALMPKTKAQLLDLWTPQGQVDTFHSSFKPGHGSTRYDDWKKQKDNVLLPIECVQSSRYEPYLVFRFCRDLPPFQKAFIGYGKDKDSWVLNVRHAGYHFQQLGGTYLVHYPHLPSKARLHFMGGPNGAQMEKPADGDLLTSRRGKVDQTYFAFLQWLANEIPDETRTPRCPGAESNFVGLWVPKGAAMKGKSN